MKSCVEDDDKHLVTIPIVPNWNLSKTCVCTPDGGILYVGIRCVNYIARIEADNVQPEIKTFPARQNLLGVDVDPTWGGKDGQQPRQFAILAEDNSLQIWDFKLPCPLIGHKVHTSAGRYVDGSMARETSVLFGYMRNGNLLSMDAQDIVMYCVTSNTYCKLPSFVSSRQYQLKVLACSPYNENIFAVGTSRGAVLICDLQLKSILYTLRGHDASVTSLSWMSAPKQRVVDSEPAGIEPTKASKVLTKSKAIEVVSTDSTSATVKMEKAEGDDEIFDIYDYDYLEQEFGAPSASVDTACAEFVGIEKQNSINNSEKFDFMEACQSLKDDLNGITSDSAQQNNEVDENDVDGDEHTGITLAECQATAAGINTQHSIDESSSHCSKEEGTDTAAAVSVHRASTSSDDMVLDGAAPTLQILHQADVHAAQCPPLAVDQESPTKTNADMAVEENNSQKKTFEFEVVEKPLDDILLASASVDGHYWIWNGLTGGAYNNMKARHVHNNRSKSQKNVDQHVEIVWINGGALLSNDKYGNMTHWLRDDSITDSHKFKENRDFHISDMVTHFAISQQLDIIWCINYKRELMCKNLATGKILAKYSCLPTGITSLAECQDNLNHIALGCPDRRICIIDVSSISPNNIDVKSYTSSISGTVTALAWSPDCKKLAFATIEGRVGVFNMEKSGQSPILFYSISGKRVYTMNWTEDGIYCVCNHILAYYDPELKSKDPIAINEAKEVTAVTVYGNYVLTGHQYGIVKVICRNEKNSKMWDILQKIVVSKRYITDMSWSPVKKTQLAVVSYSNELKIFNINGANGQLNLTHSFDMPDTKAACATVRWSYLKANLLVTAGLDGAVRVIELVDDNCVQIFLKQYDCPISTAIFMPTNEKVIICCGKSTSLEFIDTEKEASEDYSMERWKCAKNTKSNVQWAVKMLPQTSKINSSKAQTNGILKNNPVLSVKDEKEATDNITEIMENLAIDQKSPKLAEKEIEKDSESSTLYVKNPTTLLYLTTKELNKDALAKLLLILNDEHCKHSNKKNSPNAMLAKLFGSQQQAKDLLALEMSNLQKSEKTKDIGGMLMGQLNPNQLKEEILKSVQNRTLNEVHISVAPTISYQFWQRCCTAFASQLEEQGLILQAATYLLANHNQTAAIEMLVRHNFFKEALLIGRIYLQPDAPELKNIINQWIEYLNNTGNLPAAALICTLTGEINKGYTLLCKLRNSSPEIEQALKLLKTHKLFQ